MAFFCCWELDLLMSTAASIQQSAESYKPGCSLHGTQLRHAKGSHHNRDAQNKPVWVDVRHTYLRLYMMAKHVFKILSLFSRG